MDRRRFLRDTLHTAIAALPLSLFASRLFASEEVAESVDEAKEGLPTFAYYQGLGPNERRSLQRTDGTDYKMPRITPADLDAGETKVYEFWHGHSGVNHQFTVTVDDFIELNNGKTIEVYTNLVDSHRHAVRIN